MTAAAKRFLPLLLVLLLIANGQADPCSNHTLVSNQYRRSLNYVAPPEEPLLCDLRLAVGWYRFKSPSGEDLVPVSQCDIDRCGTNFPVCIQDGSIPTVAEGEVTRTVCRLGLFNCEETWNVKIKNCGAFRVYYLLPSDSCPSAYCVGTEIECPANQCSETGFTPCSTATGCPVNVTLFPVVHPDTENITGPAAGFADALGRLVFRCDFAPPPEDADLLYDVYWYVNDNQVAHFPALTSDAVGLHGRLQEAAWKTVGLGMMVKCSLRARYNETLPPARHFYSDPFYAGLEVKDREITVTEGKLGNVSVRSTVPLNWAVINGAQRGEMDVYLSKPSSQTPGVICSNAPITDVAFTADTACRVTVKANKWSEWQTLKVAAVVDAQYTGTRIALLRFTVLRNIYDQNNIWKDHSSPDVKVNILDMDRTLSGKDCQSYNDPHARTADGQYFENQRVGEFVLYNHPNFPFAVHTKYETCQYDHRVTCNCGVAIRSFDSLLVVDKCNGNNNNYGTNIREHIEYRGCDDKHLVLTRDGNTYKVTLPTGTMVTFTVHSTGINPVILHPSLADIQLSRGLCGFVSSTTSDDFRLRNGVVTHDSQQFAEDWRVPAADSLFVANPLLNDNFNVPTYCVCEMIHNNFTDTANCSLKYPNSQCPQQVTPNLKAFLHRCSGRTKKDLVYSDYVGDGPSGAAPQSRHKRAADSDIVSDPLSFPENVTSAPPQTLEWRDGWTEDSARTHCQQAFTSSAGVALMEEATGFTAIKQALLESCVLDVKYTAGTNFTQFTVETFKVICKEEVKRNVTLLETEAGRTLVAEIANASCPMDCSGHGTCQEGQCQCDQGYMGVDCSVDRSVAPQSPYIPLRGLCNTRERACQSTPVLAGNLPESGTVFCGFRAFQIREDGVHNSSQRSVTVAEPWTQVQVQCTFPRRLTRRQAQSDVMAEGYMVSISNDNVTYSTEVAVIIYDAQCLVCSADNLTCIATGQCDMTTTASPNSTSSATTSASSTPGTKASTETTPSSVVTSVTPTGTSAISAVASPSSVTSASSTVTSSPSVTSTSSVATSSLSVTSTSSTISSFSIVTSTSSALTSLPSVTSVSSVAISPSSVTSTSSAVSSSLSVTPASSVGMSSPSATSTSSAETATATLDPCLSYTLVSGQYQRSLGYVTPPGQVGLCDLRLQTGWYRFQSSAGEDLQPESNCSLYTCGTDFPVCLKDGEIPTTGEGEVTRIACRLAFMGCGEEWPIRIKNCGEYRVYWLSPTNACPSAYCVGTEVHCPAGQCSPNGFTPGCSPCSSGTPISTSGGTVLSWSSSTPSSTSPASSLSSTSPASSLSSTSPPPLASDPKDTSQTTVIAAAVTVSVMTLLVSTGTLVYFLYHRYNSAFIVTPAGHLIQVQAGHGIPNAPVEVGQAPIADTFRRLSQTSRPGSAGSISLAWTSDTDPKRQVPIN